jgi:Uma2 family endonuclease
VDWEGYLNLPDDLTHYEIIDGEVIPLASPRLKHQRLSLNCCRALRQFTRAKRLGKVVLMPRLTL